MKKILCLLFIFSGLASFSQTTDRMPGSGCNNVVTDKLAGAPNRSPSECEVQFDWKTRTALREAFGRLIRDWATRRNWVVSDTAIIPLEGVSRASENYFFSLSWFFKIDLKPESPIYRTWYEKYQAAMEALTKQPGEASGKKFTETMYQINNATHINIYITINDASQGIYFMKGGHQVLRIPGVAYAVKGPYAAGLSGGGEDNARDAALFIIGKTKANVEKPADGSEAIHLTNNLPKASHLTVQAITIRIECNDELLGAIIKEIDFSALETLIGH